MLSTSRLCNRSIAAGSKIVKHHQNFSTSTKMSSASTSSALYATVSSSSRATGAVPNNTKELRHHNKNGKGFINPWDSYVDRTASQIVSALIWYTHPSSHSISQFTLLTIATQAKALGQAEHPRHKSAHCSGPNPCLLAYTRHQVVTSNMAGTRLLLRRIP